MTNHRNDQQYEAPITGKIGQVPAGLKSVDDKRSAAYNDRGFIDSNGNYYEGTEMLRSGANFNKASQGGSYAERFQ